MGVREKGEIWKCRVCGNEVKVTEVGGGTLVCCNKSMELIREGEPKEEKEEIELEENEEEENWGDLKEETEEKNIEDVEKGVAG